MEKITIIQVGPALAVRGGVSAVERLICEAISEPFTIEHVGTMENGSAWHKLRVFTRALRILRRHLIARPPLIFHIHFASWGSTFRKMLVASMPGRQGHAVILHAHGGGFAEFMDRVPAPINRRIRRWLQSADQLIVLSTQWRRYYIEQCGVDAERVVLLPNPVRIPTQLPDRKCRPHLRLLYLGRMSESKGTFDLLNALMNLPTTIATKVRLTLAGDGAVAEIRARAAALGDRVEVLDWVDESHRNTLLAEADVFVLPSYQEGVPMSLLEAMAWGLPAITTPVGGIPDVLTHGAQGLLVQPGDVAGLTAAIVTVTTDAQERDAMGVRARSRALEFDLHNYGKQLMNIYRRVGNTHGLNIRTN